MQGVLQKAFELYNYYSTSNEEILALDATQKQLNVLFDAKEPTITIRFKMSRVQEKEKPNVANMYGSSSTSSNGNLRGELEETNGQEISLEVKLRGFIVLALSFKKSYAFGNKLEPFTLYDVVNYMRDLASSSDPTMGAQLITPDLKKIEDILVSLPEVVVEDNTKQGGGKLFLWLPEEGKLREGIFDHIKKVYMSRLTRTLKEWSSNIRPTVDEGQVEVHIVEFQPLDFVLIQDNYDVAKANSAINSVQNNGASTVFHGRGTITKGFLVGLNKHTHILTIYEMLVRRGYTISIKIVSPDNEYQPLLDVDSEVIKTLCKSGETWNLVSPCHPKYLKGFIYYDITRNNVLPNSSSLPSS
jgi:hypothetical protein